jgi:hypothetical protein
MSTISIEKFLKINSSNELENGKKLTHEEIYSSIVNSIGLKRCIIYLPATKEEIKKALKTDKHLNNIPLKKWDNQHYSFKRELLRIGINYSSLSDTVCTLKQAAKMYTES